MVKGTGNCTWSRFDLVCYCSMTTLYITIREKCPEIIYQPYSNPTLMGRTCIDGCVIFSFIRNNPLGMKGRLAQLYGKLISSLWDGTHRNLPPVELRYTLAKYAPQFNGCQQHDAQELLAFLLDGLHEDLNRYVYNISLSLFGDHPKSRYV